MEIKLNFPKKGRIMERIKRILVNERGGEV
jgi:hypothetical protein